MSDYININSLRAAKSKANYLFEGDFRRRPNQNLSGASRSLARGELLQQAAEQRQNREDIRKKELASLKLQSLWRGYCCRKSLGSLMRLKFDNVIEGLSNSSNNKILNNEELNSITKEFIIYYNSRLDEQRFNKMLDYIIENPEIIIESMASDSKSWLHRMTRLLVMNLKFLEKYCNSIDSRYLKFIDKFTNENILNSEQAVIVWRTLIDNRVYTILRYLVDNKSDSDNNLSNDNHMSTILIELLRRSLDIVPSSNTDELQFKTKPVFAFFNEFLKGPLNSNISCLYFSKLLELKPTGLNAKYILSVFENPQALTSVVMISPSIITNPIKECADVVWFCYSFVTTIYAQLDQLTDREKSLYLDILSKLIVPAEYITNLSLMQAANSEDTDENEANDSDDELDSTSKSNHISQYHTDINGVITKLVNLINDVHHINGLKTIIFNSELQQVQTAITKICNLMLSHEPLAIFNCRLLYTVAFSREFTRSLWKSITSSTIQGTTNSLIYIQLTFGNNISDESWRIILPRLRLFCSLYSYLLPTIDDEEFYTSESSLENDIKEDGMDTLQSTSPMNANEVGKPNNSLDHKQQQQQQPNQKSTSANRTYFLDKELVSISAILRDICVGFIDILYMDNRRGCPYQTSSIFETSNMYKDETSKLLSFEMKLCFKALVRLICQLHARDSRKQFCPTGHWICPSLVIPANKAIDFQLLTKQQGRLIRQMTKDDKTDRTAVSASEIKTVLILQEIPFVVSFQDRVQILHQLLRREKMIHQSDMANYHFGLPGGAIMIQIRRNYIYEDAFEKLSPENEPNLKLPLKVSLINVVGAVEAGIDGGGLTKEFLSELLKAGFDPMRGFFKSTNDQLLYPNPSANVLFANLPEGYSVHYEFLGRILGKAIFEKIMVELPMASFFLAKLLARRHSSDVDIHNLASLDPVLYKNLVYLKNYKGDVADLNLDFTISNNELDEHEVVELKPGGANILVTKDNKIEYVHLIADYRLNKQIRAQCAAFKRGISQLIDLDWLRMFDSRELQILISGAPTMIDIEDWRRHTFYTNGYTNDCDVIKTFWRIVSSFDEGRKRKLLRFATSCSLPPLLGFKDLVPQFTIGPSGEERLPTASTCINLLKLPACEDEETMRSKLLYAIDSNAGFELS